MSDRGHGTPLPGPTVSFTVAGIPAPQGSKTRTKWGVREDNPATKPWRSAVAWEATAAMQQRDLLAGPLELTATFFFPRPKSHYRTGKHAGQLRPDAPVHCQTKPDTDKLLRAIGDAVTGIVCRDDSQIVRIAAVKAYGTPRAEIQIRAGMTVNASGSDSYGTYGYVWLKDGVRVAVIIAHDTELDWTDEAIGACAQLAAAEALRQRGPP